MNVKEEIKEWDDSSEVNKSLTKLQRYQSTCLMKLKMNIRKNTLTSSVLAQCESFDFLSFNNEYSKHFTKIFELLNNYEECNTQKELLQMKIFTEYIYKK